MLNKIKEWFWELPLCDQFVYRSFVVFAIAAYVFYVRMALFVSPSMAIVERGIKLTFLFVTFVFVFSFFTRIGQFLSQEGRLRSVVWQGLAWTLYMGILGVAMNTHEGEGRYFLIIGLIYFGMMFVIIAAGKDAVLLRKLVNFLLVIFYVNVIVMLLTSNIQVLRLDVTTGLDVEIDEKRSTTTLAFMFREYLLAAPFFFALGCFWRKRMNIVVRFLYLFALVPAAYFQIYIQKFRSHIILILLTFALVVLFSTLRGKFKPLVISVLVAIVGASLYFGRMGEDVRERVDTANEMHTHQEFSRGTGWWAIFTGDRFFELYLFMNQRTDTQKLFGGGIGATYDASEMFGEQGYSWRSVHIGFFLPMLVGGVFYMLFYVGVYLCAILRRLTPFENADGFLVACKIYVCVIFARYWIAPMNVTDQVMPTMIIWLCIGALLSTPKNYATCAS